MMGVRNVSTGDEMRRPSPGQIRFTLAIVVSIAAIALLPWLLPMGYVLAALVVVIALFFWLYPWIRFRMGKRYGRARDAP